MIQASTYRQLPAGRDGMKNAQITEICAQRQFQRLALIKLSYYEILLTCAVIRPNGA
jgi:hypothetical protein